MPAMARRGLPAVALLLLLVLASAAAFTAPPPVPTATTDTRRRRSTSLLQAAKPFDDDTPAGQWLSPQELAHASPPPALARSLSKEAHALACLAACPLIAVLRGVTAVDLPAVMAVLRQQGITMVSVPAESPAGLESLRHLTQQQQADDDDDAEAFALGAATVISPQQVDIAAAAGAAFISCPHTDPAILQRATHHGLLCLPGIMTPTDAFVALQHGAQVLKLFPSQAIPPGMVRSLAAVVPPPAQLIVSGGVQVENMAEYIAAGAKGFALGSTLYAPGLTAEELGARARLFVAGVSELRRKEEEKAR